jgi:hypothetical protein
MNGAYRQAPQEENLSGFYLGVYAQTGGIYPTAMLTVTPWHRLWNFD